jgi:hypothetical protein
MSSVAESAAARDGAAEAAAGSTEELHEERADAPEAHGEPSPTDARVTITPRELLARGACAPDDERTDAARA